MDIFLLLWGANGHLFDQTTTLLRVLNPGFIDPGGPYPLPKKLGVDFPIWNNLWDSYLELHQDLHTKNWEAVSPNHPKKNKWSKCPKQWRNQSDLHGIFQRFSVKHFFDTLPLHYRGKTEKRKHALDNSNIISGCSLAICHHLKFPDNPEAKRKNKCSVAQILRCDEFVWSLGSICHISFEVL